MADIDWVPKRLNSPPVVFRGMTGREVVIVIAIGGLLSLPVGIISAFIIGSVAMVPTVCFLCSGIGLVSGGTIMRRLRRGKPVSLMYRRLQFALAKKGFISAGERLITESSVYSIRRSAK